MFFSEFQYFAIKEKSQKKSLISRCQEHLFCIITIPKIFQQIGQKNISSMNNQVAYPFFISNKFIDFSESLWIFSIFFTFMKISFLKKIEAITMQLLVRSPGTILCVIWNRVEKKFEIRNVTFIFLNSQKNVRKSNKIAKKFMDFEKSINLFKIKKG